MKTREIRQKYLEFFTQKGHLVLPSCSVIPGNDPTLLFTTAGMVPFKAYFAGVETPPSRRIATVQKSLRAGGKGSDLENVGRTSRHHTLFEMLGNFSFGDYFKKESIEWAWEFVTEWVKLPKDKLWVSIYESDDEAFDLWNKVVGVPADRIVRLGKKDNFWGPAGDSGACGPCSEIYMDMGPARAVEGPELKPCTNANCRPGCDCERYLEFWNLVFNQFYQEPDGTQKPLPQTGVDTGMGLERLTMILQNVSSPYETDLLAQVGETILGMTPGNLKLPLPKAQRFALNAVIDHTRALTFAIADGVIPSNEGRGYVLRRILRRAGRFAKQLGLEEPFMYKVVHKVVDLYKDTYPELYERRGHVESTVKAEEERFHTTLRNGMNRLLEYMEEMKIAGTKTLAGEKAFLLHDTFGFPFDLTKEELAEHHFTVDEDDFKRRIGEQKDVARGRSKFGGGDISEGLDATLLKELGGTFAGYGLKPGQHVWELDGELSAITEADQDGLFRFVLKPTPFYPEGGGQVADQGVVEHPDFAIEVLQAKTVGDAVVHLGRFTRTPHATGPITDKLRRVPVKAKVRRESRMDSARHHTATHVLHAALRRHLGDHVRQAGSLVTPERLRFDFSHPKAIGPEVMAAIEREVNDVVLDNLPADIVEMDYKEAVAKGAMAFFGDKYGARVRTVRLGDYSFELCGGTHVGGTGEIGLFTLVSESSVAAGTRRVEALSGVAARNHMNEQLAKLRTVADTLKVAPDQIVKRVEGLLTREKELNKKVDELQMKLATGGGGAESKVEQIDGIKYSVQNLGELDMQGLRNAADTLMNKLETGVLVLGSSVGDKVFLVAKVAKDIAGKKVHAGNLIRPIAEAVGGSGGGRPDMAQAGGDQPGKLNDALGLVHGLLKGQVGA